jgi:hypothetical protein
MQKNNKKYFYVYYSYEHWGRGYIGKRECWCLPEEDVKYFGSFSDKTFKPTEKIILKTFDTLEEVLLAEVLLHNYYEVDENSHFANKSKQTSKGFYFSASGKDHPRFGKETPIEVRKKQSKSMLGEKNPMYGRTRVHSEETREKLRKKAKEYDLRKKLQSLEEN